VRRSRQTAAWRRERCDGEERRQNTGARARPDGEEASGRPGRCSTGNCACRCVDASQAGYAVGLFRGVRADAMAKGDLLVGVPGEPERAALYGGLQRALGVK
jgi:hypothetical protein